MLPTNSVPPMPDDVTGMTAWSAGGRSGLLLGLSHYESQSTNLPGFIWVQSNGSPPSEQVLPVPPVSATLSSSGPLASADIDGDGQLELFVGGRVIPGAYPKPASSHILRQDHGRL